MRIVPARLVGAALGCGAILVSLACAATAGRRGAPPPHPNKKGPSPIEQKKLSIVTGKPFEKKAAKVRLLPLQAGGVFVSNTVPLVADNALVGTAPKHWGMPTIWNLVDLKKGTTLAKVKTVGEASAAAKMAVVALGDTEADRAAILRLDDGKILEPEPQFAGVTQKAKDVRIIVDRRRPVVWVFAKRPTDGRPFQAQWKDLSNPKIEMTEDLPFWPAHFSGKNGIQVWSDTPGASPRGCDRIVFDPQDPWRCRPLPTAAAPPMDLLEDCVRSDGEAWLADDCGSPPPLSCGKARALLMSPDPVRALAVCTDDPQHPRFVLWSPKHTWIWDDEPGASWKNIIPERAFHTVVGMETYAKADAPVKRWLDDEKGILWNGPPMRPLQLSEHREDRRRLVQPADKHNELWVVDVDAGTAERIAADIDCDNQLFTYAQQGDRATIECLPKAVAGSIYSDEKRLASWKWMEVIDLKARKRWRTTEVFESKIGEHGAVVGTKRGKPARLAVVETP